MSSLGSIKALKPIRTSNYCVAYLDVLGAEKYMEEDSDKFLNDLNSIYYDATLDIAFTNFVDKKDVFSKIFSDNILLAIKINNNDEARVKKIEKIINIAGNIYNTALTHGYLMRGAITEGKFYNSKEFVYGKALIDTVKMEEKFAIYPRIIVTESIKELLPQYFEKCADGWNMLNCFIFPGLTLSASSLKQGLLKALKEVKDDMKAKQKVVWAITYYNEYYRNPNNFGHLNAQLITDEEIQYNNRGGTDD